ncbi:DHA2 family multidrug resistance protein-like MFS transporter [Streptosporangium becharense]|uniref:DHA2 family multidrug resistance protein-like MFS transporter n=1 Tax=Streptosporangium becharense TaxID=1816182 RepID=A0A7W9MF42_9ACTN|nr:MFS transporter [Streptosporangium becharense]MBB2913049.1 DHA2 family multidrug resistance protein-like MFS transporter [Streptosporangium becharense]MBB5818126.1 DHA2 family multidrug resistance protein-like MFS transporter [Streptosporangium becharense]
MVRDVTTAGRKEWLGLAVLVLPVLLISVTVTVLYFALPFLSADLSPTGSQLLWIVDIYAFLLAGLLITMGTLGDRIGRRKLLLLGATAFGITSVIAAYAPNADLLIAARALQGAAAASLMPPTLALIRNMFHDQRQRRMAIALWAASFAGGSVLGPIVGGWLLEHFWWGSVFLINVPVMLLLLVLGPILLPEYRDPDPGRFDLLSAVLSLAAVLPIVYGVKQFAADDFGAVSVLSVVAGLLIGAAFLNRQRKLPDPMLDLRLFAGRGFTMSLITSTLAIFALVGLFYFIAQYLQMVLGLRPFVAGLLTLPAAGMALVGSILAAALAQRVRPGHIMGGGMALGAAGFLAMSQVDVDSERWVLIVGLVLLGAGIGAVQALASDMIVAVAPPERAGSASAVLEAATELGGALGIAILGSVGLAVYRDEFTTAAPAELSPEDAEAARETLGGAVGVAGRLPEQAGAELLDVARAAFTGGMQVAALMGTVLMAATAVLATILLRKVRVDASTADARTE